MKEGLKQFLGNAESACTKKGKPITTQSLKKSCDFNLLALVGPMSIYMYTNHMIDLYQCTCTMYAIRACILCSAWMRNCCPVDQPDSRLFNRLHVR